MLFLFELITGEDDLTLWLGIRGGGGGVVVTVVPGDKDRLLEPALLLPPELGES